MLSEILLWCIVGLLVAGYAAVVPSIVIFQRKNRIKKEKETEVFRNYVLELHSSLIDEIRQQTSIIEEKEKDNANYVEVIHSDVINKLGSISDKLKTGIKNLEQHNDALLNEVSVLKDTLSKGKKATDTRRNGVKKELEEKLKSLDALTKFNSLAMQCVNECNRILLNTRGAESAGFLTQEISETIETIKKFYKTIGV